MFTLILLFSLYIIKEVSPMDTELFNFLTTQGVFALLFGYLLFYILKQNQIREENYY